MQYYVGGVMTTGETVIIMLISGLMGVFSFHFNYGKGGAVCGNIFILRYIFYSTTIISRIFAKFLKNAPSNINQNHFYVNYGNEQSGILYGEIWLGSQVYLFSTVDHSEAVFLGFHRSELRGELRHVV